MHRIPAAGSWRTLSPALRRSFATTGRVVKEEGVAHAKAEATQKRFWKSVHVTPSKEDPEAFIITLDKRPLKTPGGKPLAVPSSRPLLASLIAHEWDMQENSIRTYALPLTSLTSRAIDGMTNDEVHAKVRNELLRYFDTDTICFHEHDQEGLIRLQETHWIPLIEWAKDKFGVEIRIFTELLGNQQPPETRKAFEEHIAQYDPWQLAALERATFSTKSFLIALALVEGRLTVEEAAHAANVEVNAQILRWGEVEDSHDVDYHDLRRTLGSVTALLARA
ncbi:ATP12-domain-containing protein [Calocera cornea HHB12733]|uniref:ATP12-domain-containing protein n=1 Tax=Calocera cornea HHB12733 TaxID=1353952 RepID=A0A165IBH1_9BASI|nr:ATP12-domain-containing protein [Calocera cornea HHB12733]